jgi:hypothetical protein
VNEQTATYSAAVDYACEILGDAASNFFPRLHELSRYNSLDELRSVVDGWRPPTPNPTPEPTPKPERWTPCKHFGGDRECVTCRRKEAVAALAMEQIKRVNESLNVGAAYRVPAHLRHRKFLGYSATGKEKYSETQLVDDAVQTGWVKLLEGGVPVAENPEAQQEADKQANIIGQTAGHDVVKEQRKYVTLPQTRENEDGSMVTVAPWDVIDPSDSYRLNANPELTRIFGAFPTLADTLKQFSQTNPEDFAFLVTYLSNRRLGRFTRIERNRAGAIVKKLRRRVEKAEKAVAAQK